MTSKNCILELELSSKTKVRRVQRSNDSRRYWRCMRSPNKHARNEIVSASQVCLDVLVCLRADQVKGIDLPSNPANSIKQPLVDFVVQLSPARSASGHPRTSRCSRSRVDNEPERTQSCETIWVTY